MSATYRANLLIRAAELIPEHQQLVAVGGVLSKGLKQVFVEFGKPLTTLGTVTELSVRRSEKWPVEWITVCRFTGIQHLNGILKLALTEQNNA